MLTPEQQELVALDELLDDYAVLVAETRARLAWLEGTVLATEVAIAGADTADEAAPLTLTLVDLARFAGVLEGRLAVYRHYQRALGERRSGDGG